MNNVVISGFLQKKAEYLLGNDGVTKYRFLVEVYCHGTDSKSTIPVICKGRLADECYAKIKVGYYLEVVGEITRSVNSSLSYVLANSISFRPPTGSNVVHIRTTEFLECFDTSKVLERLEKDGKKKS